MHSSTLRFVAWGLACFVSVAAWGAANTLAWMNGRSFKGDSGFSGLSPDETLKPPLKLVWSYRLDGDASGTPAPGWLWAEERSS